MNKTTIALLTETTWFSKGNKKISHDLKTLELRDDIALLRKDRSSRGGGIALAFDSKTSDFKKLPLSSLRGQEYEILAARGKITGVKKNSPLPAYETVSI